MAQAAPSSSQAGAMTSAAAFTFSGAFAMAMPSPAQRSMEMSFSPSPMAMVSSRGMPRIAATRASPAALLTPVGTISSASGLDAKQSTGCGGALCSFFAARRTVSGRPSSRILYIPSCETSSGEGSGSGVLEERCAYISEAAFTRSV